jgi:hypothetical protein
MKIIMEYIFLLEIGIMKGSKILGFFNNKRNRIERDQQENILSLCNINFDLFKTIPGLAQSAIEMLKKTKDEKSINQHLNFEKIRDDLFGGSGIVTRIIVLLLNDMKNIPGDESHRDTLSSKFSSLTQLNQKLLDLEILGKKFRHFSNFNGTLNSQGVNELIHCLDIIKFMIENSAKNYNPEKFKPRVLDSAKIKKQTRILEGFIKRCDIVNFLSETSCKEYLPGLLIQETYFLSTRYKKNDLENIIPSDFSSIKELYEKSWLCSFIKNFNKEIYSNVNDLFDQLFNNLDIHCFFTTPFDFSKVYQKEIRKELENLGCDPFKNHLNNFNIILNLHKQLKSTHDSILNLTQSVENTLVLCGLLEDLKMKMIDFRFQCFFSGFYESYNETYGTLNNFLKKINNIVRDINRETIHEDLMHSYGKAIKSQCFGRDKLGRDKFELFINTVLISVKQLEEKASVNQFIDSIKAVRTTWLNVLKSTHPNNRGLADHKRKLSDSYSHSKKLEVLLLNILCDRDIDCLGENGINKKGFFIAIQFTLIIQLTLLLSERSSDNKKEIKEILKIFNSALSSAEIKMSVGQIEKDYMPQPLPEACELLLPNLLSNPGVNENKSPGLNKNKSDPGFNNHQSELDDNQCNLEKRLSVSFGR